MMQNVQRWSQPFWTSTKARDRSAKPATRCGAVSRTAMISDTLILAASGAKERMSNLSRLPRTRATSGMAAKVSGSTCAAQPVTKISASGLERFALRIACRVWRTASLVTAQLLTMMRSSRSPASSRIASLSAAFSRQPMVITSGPVIRAPQGRSRR
jgi:hypothetical protein